VLYVRDGNGSWVKWVTIFGWVAFVMGHCQWPIDPWWWNNCAVACNCLFFVDVQKLPTQSVSPIVIAGGLILIYDFFCSQDREGCPVPPCHAPYSPMRRIKWCNGHRSLVTGHVSRKMTHFHLCFTYRREQYSELRLGNFSERVHFCETRADRRRRSHSELTLEPSGWLRPSLLVFIYML